MARARYTNPSERPLLSAWEAPAEAGAPEGVLATTFTLDTALFEEECLARFAGVQSDPARDGALYRIEREEKLASLRCAAVVADIHHCSGKRSLRWDLLAARPTSGVMHAKIGLLAWKRHVRAIIASANLTEPGYRSNQECFAVLDFDSDSADRTLLDPLLEYLREILSLTTGPARNRAETFLEWVNDTMPPSTGPGRGMQRKLILVAPGRPSVFQQVADFIPKNSPPGEAHVVSPFFDAELRHEGPEQALWGLLKQRGAAAVHFHVAGEFSPEAKIWRLACPSHLAHATPRSRREVETAIHPVQVTGVRTDVGPEARPLHAKSVWLEHESWCALMVGSSNFTSAGLGLRVGKAASNYEANVLHLLRGDPSESERRALAARQLRGSEAIDLGKQTEFAPAIDPDRENEDQPPALPAFFSEANVLARGQGRLQIRLRFSGQPPNGAWSIRADQGDILDSASWNSRGKPSEIDLGLQDAQHIPSTLSVTWDPASFTAEWPVNATAADVLPPPPELQGLSLAALLDLLGSRKPLHEALRKWLRRQATDDDVEPEAAVELIDPHAKVDTSGFLVKRVQRACWAIEELCRRLGEPVSSSTAMAWRLYGPVGARAVLDATRKQCDVNLPDEWLFLLCELMVELRAIRGSGPDPTGDPEIHRMLEDFVAHIRIMIKEAQSGGSEGMRGYVARALEEQTE